MCGDNGDVIICFPSAFRSSSGAWKNFNVNGIYSCHDAIL